MFGMRPRTRSATSGPKERLELSQFARLLIFVKPYRWQLLIGMISVGIAGGLGLVLPQFVGGFFNTFTSGKSFLKLNNIVFILLGIFIIQAIFSFLRTYLLGLVGEGVVADMRSALYSHLIYLPLRFFSSRKTGEITSRLTSDVAVVQSAVSQALAQFINQSVLLLGSMVLLFVTNLWLTLVMLAVVPVVVLGAAFFGRLLRRVSTEFQDKVAGANASAEESLAGVRVVQSFTAEGLEATRYHNLIQASYQVAKLRARFRAFFVSGISLAMFAAISVVIWYGARLVMAGSLSPGDLVKFLLYTFMVAGGVGSMTGLYSTFQQALGASRRIFELLDEESDLPEPSEPTRLETVRGQVRFDKVHFDYGDRGNQEVLHGVSLDAKPGEIVALVGPTGAGKTTLAMLIPRFYDPTAGHVSVDGVEVRELALHDLRAHIGIVPQETLLFSGSIEENIRYGRPDATDEEVTGAAIAANAHEFVSSFPEGYATVVGERGIKLSGGQRQRIAIARALLKDPRILILDEATSSLDNEAEALVQMALERLMEGRTTFVIAHRLSTVRRADRILVIDQGRIVQRGTHDALLEQGGLYRDLYELQFRTKEDILAGAVS